MSLLFKMLSQSDKNNVEAAYNIANPNKEKSIDAWLDEVKGTDKVFYVPGNTVSFSITESGRVKYVPKTAGVMKNVIENSMDVSSLYTNKNTHSEMFKGSASNKPVNVTKQYNINGIVVKATSKLYGNFNKSYKYKGKSIYLTLEDYQKVTTPVHDKRPSPEALANIESISDENLRKMLIDIKNAYEGVFETDDTELRHGEFIELREDMLEELNKIQEHITLLGEELLPASISDLILSTYIVSYGEKLVSSLKALNEDIYDRLYIFETEKVISKLDSQLDTLNYMSKSIDEYNEELLIDPNVTLDIEDVSTKIHEMNKDMRGYINNRLLGYRTYIGIEADRTLMLSEDDELDVPSRTMLYIDELQLTWQSLSTETEYNTLNLQVKNNIGVTKAILDDTIVISKLIDYDIRSKVTQIANTVSSIINSIVQKDMMKGVNIKTERDKNMEEQLNKIAKAIEKFRAIDDTITKEIIQKNPVHNDINSAVTSYMRWTEDVTEEAIIDIIYCEEMLSKFLLFYKNVDKSGKFHESASETMTKKANEILDVVLQGGMKGSGWLIDDNGQPVDIDIKDYYEGWRGEYPIIHDEYYAKMYFINRLFGNKKYYMDSLVRLLRSGIIRDKYEPSVGETWDSEFETKHMSDEGGAWMYKDKHERKYFSDRSIDISEDYELTKILSEYKGSFTSAKFIENFDLGQYVVEHEDPTDLIKLKFKDELYEQIRFVVFKELCVDDQGAEELIHVFNQLYNYVSSSSTLIDVSGEVLSEYETYSETKSFMVKYKTIKDVIFEWSFIDLLKDISPINFKDNDTIVIINKLLEGQDKRMELINRAITYIEMTGNADNVSITTMFKPGFYKKGLNLIFDEYIGAPGSVGYNVKRLLSKNDILDLEFEVWEYGKLTEVKE